MASITEIKPPRQHVSIGDPSVVVASALSAASTNATAVKTSPGTVYGLIVINTTSTIYYLKLYNLAAAPVPATDTPYMTIPIPHSSAAGGGIVSITTAGIPFTTGIAYALVGGIAVDDNTNAATGVAINVIYS
jgi:hypothetical protein